MTSALYNMPRRSVVVLVPSSFTMRYFPQDLHKLSTGKGRAGCPSVLLISLLYYAGKSRCTWAGDRCEMGGIFYFLSFLLSIIYSVFPHFFLSVWEPARYDCIVVDRAI